ncbi:MAG: DUF4900 domain-containing protein [Candidatus Eisenbacteria bacterium]|nr:DUF4900 domain-containing protein [Candidatus Eisenbacteria bacterium]
MNAKTSTRTGGRAGLSSERGSTLVAVLAIVTAVLLVGAALFILGTAESDLVEYTVDNARAFYLAEAGQEAAQGILEEMAQAEPPSFPDSGTLEDQALGDGTYDFTVTKISGAYPWLIEYEIVSTGEVDGVTSTITSRIRRETFAQYLFFTSKASDIWFTTGDSLHGRVHSNDKLKIDGDPWFGSKVTSSSSNITITQGSNPVFEQGYELGVDEVPFPSGDDIKSAMRAQAQDGGLYGGELNGRNAYYQVVLGRNGATGTISFRSYSRRGWRYRWSGWTDVDISTFNGVIWSEEPFTIEGVLDGELTMGSDDDIWITDDVLYEGSSPGHGPDEGCDDLLGLVAAKDIIVADTWANRNDVEIHAHMLALWKSLKVEDYNQGSPRGDLTIWGGVAQYKRGPVGTFNKWGMSSGYNKDYHFDSRLSGWSPPGYPQTNRYIQVSWTES